MNSRVTQVLLAGILIVLAYIAFVPNATQRAAALELKRDAWDKTVMEKCRFEDYSIWGYSHQELMVTVGRAYTVGGMKCAKNIELSP